MNLLYGCNTCRDAIDVGIDSGDSCPDTTKHHTSQSFFFLEKRYPTKATFLCVRIAAKVEALLQLGLTFAWVHFTADTSFITLASLVLSALTITAGILDLVVRAIIRVKESRNSLLYELSKAVAKTSRVKKLSNENLRKVFPLRAHDVSHQSADIATGDHASSSKSDDGPSSRAML